MTAEQQTQWTLVRTNRYGPNERVRFRKPLDSQSHIWVHLLPVVPGVEEEMHLMFKTPYTDTRGDVWQGTVLGNAKAELVEIGLARHIWIDLCSRQNRLQRNGCRTPVWIPEERTT